MKLRIAIMFALTLAGQRALGHPGLPAWCADLQLLTVWIVAPALRIDDRRWLYWAVVMGVLWDLLGQPVIGPGGIAWSAAAMALSVLGGFIADRSARAWALFGAVAAVVVVLAHTLALIPLGFAPSLTAADVGRSAVLSGLWCGAVGLAMAVDLPKYWRAYRLRKLR
jgi:hypothetical protein